MSTLIIPDLHHHTQNADRWLNAVQFDRVIFLGDYFDYFDDKDCVEEASETASWLARQMEQPNCVFLLGNHDAAYMFPECPALHCPGFTKAKARAIHKILRPKHWKRFQIATVEGGWLISHAGFHPSLIAGLTLDAILKKCARALRNAARGTVDPILRAGLDRDGSQPVGGPLWLDWESLVPIRGINQIVGHTPGGDVREKVTADSKNYCLDVRNGSAAAILSNGEIQMMERPRGWAASRKAYEHATLHFIWGGRAVGPENPCKDEKEPLFFWGGTPSQIVPKRSCKEALNPVSGGDEMHPDEF